MSFGTLALIGLCGLCGPLLSVAGRGAVPVVIGEIVAGVIVGRTGLRIVDTSNVTLTFLSNIGFAMLMFSSGLNVPLRDPGVRASTGRGVLGAGAVAVFAVGGGVLASRIGGAGHPAVYTVLLASSSAAIVLPIVQERGLTGPSILTVTAQVAVADVAGTIAIPFVLGPSRAAKVAGGTILIAVCVIAVYAVGHRVRQLPVVQTVRAQSQRRRWAIDLRIALTILFALSWIAERTGTSLLIAGFGAGLMIAATGGPERLSTEVLGVAGGFFIPLFFVVLGASINLRGLVQDPALLGLAFALAGLTVVVHVAGAMLTRQPPATGLLASAQVGVPAAIVALGLPAHVLTSAQGAAIIAASIISLGVCAAGAALLARRFEGRTEAAQA
jgi:Kef-type K+ transport system membrane component KefB